jgi:hypothetical protein
MTRQVFDSLADAVYAMAHYTDGPSLTAQAAAMGVPASWLRDAVDAHRKPRYPLETLVPHTRASGNYTGVRTLCRLVGGSFLLHPTTAAHESDVLIALGEVLREVGEDAEAIGKALADNGRLDAHEAPDILTQIDESIEKLSALRAIVAKRCDSKPRAVVR